MYVGILVGWHFVMGPDLTRSALHTTISIGWLKMKGWIAAQSIQEWAQVYHPPDQGFTDDHKISGHTDTTTRVMQLMDTMENSAPYYYSSINTVGLITTRRVALVSKIQDEWIIQGTHEGQNLTLTNPLAKSWLGRDIWGHVGF